MSILLCRPLTSLHPASNRLAPTICRMFASTKNNNNNNNNNTNIINQDKASPEQLTLLEHKLVRLLPAFFVEAHPLDIYTQDVMFVNNIRNFKSKGLNYYAMQITLFKICYSMLYSSKKLQLLNLVKNPEESYIRIRWRILTRPGLLGSFIQVVKLEPKGGEKWKDGISTLHVNNKGLIHCHVCDNIDVDINEANGTNKRKQSVKNPVYC